VEGYTVIVESRWTDGRPSRPADADDPRPGS